VSINGANRLGSNSLPELLVFGARAGRAAAEYASGQKEPGPAVLAQAADEKRRLEKEFLDKAATSPLSPQGERGRGEGERLALLREEMQRTTEQSAGIYRSGDSLAQAADKLRQLQERFRKVALQDRSRTFNTELIAALELSFMLDVAEAIVHCALAREESRGAHQRTDFPARDDQRFLAHSLIYRNPDGSCRVEYLPVTITRWPPAERVYGK
jgi:fumarate reductase flavoprotein subunit